MTLKIQGLSSHLHILRIVKVTGQAKNTLKIILLFCISWNRSLGFQSSWFQMVPERRNYPSLTSWAVALLLHTLCAAQRTKDPRIKVAHPLDRGFSKTLGQRSCYYYRLALGIEPRSSCWAVSPVLLFVFLFRDRSCYLADLFRLGSNFQSCCFRVAECYDYRHAPPCEPRGQAVLFCTVMK